MIIHKHFRNKRKPGIFPPLFPASEAAARSKKNHQVPSLKVGAGVTQIASTSNDAHLEVSQNGDINDTYVYIYVYIHFKSSKSLDYLSIASHGFGVPPHL